MTLTEVDKVINRRPITYMCESSDPGGGVPIPLSPEQFLLLAQGDTKEEEWEMNLSEEFRGGNKWLSSMNDLWKKEYLHLLLGSQGEVWKTVPNPVKEGEVVLVADDREKRLNWKLRWVFSDSSFLVVMEDAAQLLFKSTPDY